MFLRDLIDTTNVYMKMMEKFCQGSIVVQTKAKKKKKAPSKKAGERKKKDLQAKKQPSKEEVMVRMIDKQKLDMGRIKSHTKIF